MAIVLAVTALVGGCSRDDAPPDRLMDGTKASAPPVDLEGVELPAVMTTVRVIAAAERRGTSSASCLEDRWNLHPGGPSVERMGVTSESITFEEVSDRSVFGCDNSPGSREDGRRWCGGAYGQLFAGRLRDPRLDVICETSEGARMGFVWVEPGDRTRYVAVRQPAFAEVYEVAGDLPIRIATTSGLDEDPLGATFDISEHDAIGRLLVRRQVRAAPAG